MSCYFFLSTVVSKDDLNLIFFQPVINLKHISQHLRPCHKLPIPRASIVGRGIQKPLQLLSVNQAVDRRSRIVHNLKQHFSKPFLIFRMIGLRIRAFPAKEHFVRKFSFSNIDKYSTGGIITRLTTDVTNVQMAFMMIIRIAVRSPLTLVFSFAMCMIISPRLSAMFLIAVAFLVVVIGVIMVDTLKIFRQVFRRYDDLNASVQENVTAIRVVKAYVREDHERDKFNKAAQNLYRLFVKAESMLALNNPVMEVADGSIDFEHVSFVYKHGTGEDTLEDIDLHIKSGETIEIIGGTGCGKSSLVNLISRLYDA